jgi:hypothetical protein
MCKQWCVLFDNEGLDTLVPWGELAADRMLTKLSGSEMSSANPQHIVSRMMLRARFNLQRFPEVWTYQTDEDIEYEDMRSLWEDSPQYMADLIREKGDQLFGDKPGTRRKPAIV